jgi:hypothetical protein
MEYEEDIIDDGNSLNEITDNLNDSIYMKA